MSNPIQPPGSYPSMPEAVWGEPTAQGPAPATVVNAARLIIVRVVLALLGVIVTLTTQDSLRSDMAKASPTLDQHSLDVAMGVAIAVSVVSAVVIAILWGALAWLIVKGKNWARIVIWVFAGLALLFGLISLLRPSGVLSLVMGVLDIGLDAAIIVLLAQRPSAEFFRRR